MRPHFSVIGQVSGRVPMVLEPNWVARSASGRYGYCKLRCPLRAAIPESVTPGPWSSRCGLPGLGDPSFDTLDRGPVQQFADRSRPRR